MDKTIDNFKAAVLAVVGLLTGLWGWLGWLVVGWIVCMVLDYITGSMAAAKEGQWSSAMQTIQPTTSQPNQPHRPVSRPTTAAAHALI